MDELMNNGKTKDIAARLARPAEEGLLLLYPISENSGHESPCGGNRKLYLKTPSSRARNLIGIAISFPQSRHPQPVEAYLTGTVEWRPVNDTILPEIWAQLKNNRPTSEIVNAKIGIPDITTRLLCALDIDDHRHLLITLLPSETGFEDRQSRGLFVVTRELRIQGGPLTQYLDITCQDVSGYDAFDLIWQ